VQILLAQMEGATETALNRQLDILFDAGIVTRDEAGNWLLCRDLNTVSFLDLYRAGAYYLPVDEELEVPSVGEWDEAFFNSIRQGELNMQQSLKSMYTEVVKDKEENS
jgi:DNA-binding transcriptional ArsR family regulator